MPECLKAFETEIISLIHYDIFLEIKLNSVLVCFGFMAYEPLYTTKCQIVFIHANQIYFLNTFCW